jgi:formylglycine-generating enzyme required for sulfatase activity
VLVNLCDFDGKDSPVEFLQRFCGNESLRARLQSELDNKRVCILCDGLNDLPGENYMKAVSAWRRFAKQYEGNLFAFACRSAAYRGELHFREVTITPLNDERIVRTLFLVLGESADELWQSLEGGLRELARIPLFLIWLIQSLKRSGGRLPQNKSLLVRGLIDTLALRDQESGRFEHTDSEQVINILAEIAFQIQARSLESGVDTDKVLQIVQEAGLTGADMTARIAEAKAFGLSIGILIEKNRRIYIVSPVISDFLCGAALKARFDNGEDISDYFVALSVANPEPDKLQSLSSNETQDEMHELPPPVPFKWEEPIIFASGLANESDRFIQVLCEQNVLIAARCLATNGLDIGASTVDTVRQRVVAGATEACRRLDERLVFGDDLGKIGDPRFASQDRDKLSIVTPTLVEIPAGAVLMGSEHNDPLGFADEKPRHEICLQPFSIGRFPVTNVEYRKFVEAGGYECESLWTDAGWRWRTTRDSGEGSMARMLRNLLFFREHRDELERWFKDARVSPFHRQTWLSLLPLPDNEARSVLMERGYGTFRSKDGPAFQHDSRYNGSNQPVVGVTWHEAMAYCSWVSAVTGRRFTLPSEPQWERAAKGDSDISYPWGCHWEVDRCNSLEERVLRPSPVGIFPLGRSPFGCEDMVGNVFEWTVSLYRPYPYDAQDGREDASTTGVRVNRGGGWDSTNRVTRCSLRGDMCEPETYDINLGFRLCTPD